MQVLVQVLDYRFRFAAAYLYGPMVHHPALGQCRGEHQIAARAEDSAADKSDTVCGGCKCVGACSDGVIAATQGCCGIRAIAAVGVFAVIRDSCSVHVIAAVDVIAVIRDGCGIRTIAAVGVIAVIRDSRGVRAIAVVGVTADICNGEGYRIICLGDKVDGGGTVCGDVLKGIAGGSGIPDAAVDRPVPHHEAVVLRHAGEGHAAARVDEEAAFFSYRTVEPFNAVRIFERVLDRAGAGHVHIHAIILLIYQIHRHLGVAAEAGQRHGIQSVGRCHGLGGRSIDGKLP